jgi:hypothetical protein
MLSMKDSDKKLRGSEINTAGAGAGASAGASASASADEYSSVSTPLQPRDFEKLAVVQNATAGKSVVISGGGCYTAEAWEVDRKMRTLQQLQTARKFRAIMERALEDAKKSGSNKQAMEIFENHKKTILEMASLTDAIKGGYTLDSYDEYTKRSRRTFQAQRSHRTAQSIFSDVRKRMAWENCSELFTKEKRLVELERQLTLERHETNANRIEQKNINIISKNDSKKRKKCKPINEASTSKTDTKISPSKKKKKENPPPNPLVQKQASPLKVQANADPPSKKSPKVIAKRSSSRKCHYCKDIKADFIACSYWHINGKQCKKTFCLSCIAQNPLFNRSSIEKEFQCPSCLGTCDCCGCVRIREHEVQIARSSKRLSRDGVL